MMYATLQEVKKLRLVQLTHWLPSHMDNIDYCTREYSRISKDKTRSCKVVRRGERIAVFVDDVARKAVK